MDVVIAIVVIAAVIGAVVWNHRDQNEAMEGHRFGVSGAPTAVTQAISTEYCSGARAAIKGFVWRVSVTPSGIDTFLVSTKIGDTGRIEVRGDGTGSVVHAYTTRLYIGSHPMTWSNKSTFYGLVGRLNHLINKALGISVNAGRMKKFQRRVERQVNRQLRRSAA